MHYKTILVIFLTICVVTQVGTHPALAAASTDQYGYTWTDSAPDTWQDASAGSRLALESYSTQAVAVPLPFAFSFYGKPYTQAYVSRHGYLTFVPSAAWPDEGRLGEFSEPNGVVAGYWSPLLYPGSDGVYTYSGGTTPDRYVVMEWRAVKDLYQNTYTFEIVLQENGDIRVHFGTITKLNGSGYYCGRVGIEDEVGSDGLVYQNCMWPTLNEGKHVRFVNPAPQARVHLYPGFQSSFTAPNEHTAFPLNLANTGSLGPDSYDIQLSSTWPASITTLAGSVLAVSGSQGSAGPLAQAESLPLLLQVQSPPVINYAEINQADAQFISNQDLSRTAQVSVQTGAPAPFVQAYVDSAQSAVIVEALQSDRRIRRAISLNGRFANNAAVIERPDKNLVVLWNNMRCLDSSCYPYIYEIRYAILDPNLNIIRLPSSVIDESATPGQADYDFAAAVAPNGEIGLLWIHAGSNSQVTFARLNSTGAVIGAQTLTYPPTPPASTDYSNPVIAATTGNKYVVAWQQSTYNGAAATSYNDIGYAVLGANGSLLKTPTLLTHDTSSYSDAYQFPALAALNNGSVLLTYSTDGPAQDEELYYLVLDAAGTITRAPSLLTTDGHTVQEMETDIVQLPNGNIFIAWRGFRLITSFEAYNQVRYTVLDASYTVLQPTQVIYESDLYEPFPVSVTHDGLANAILTWVDGASYRLYYALVSAGGALRTQPMVIHTSNGSTPAISASGAGSTTRSIATTSAVDLVSSLPAVQLAHPAPNLPAASGADAALLASGQTVEVVFDLLNLGKATASDITIQMEVDSRLGLDPSQIIPAPDTINGSTYRWHLPDFQYLGFGEIRLPVTVPGPVGTRYPVTFTLDSPGLPVKSWTVYVVSSTQVFLPIVSR